MSESQNGQSAPQPVASQAGSATTQSTAQTPAQSATQATPNGNGPTGQGDQTKKAGKTEQELKDEEFRKLVIQLGDLTADMSDKVLAARINQLVSGLDVPGRRDRPEYRTAVAYAVQDVIKEGMSVGMPGGLRVELGQLAATYPGLQNRQMQDLVASTPGIDDKATVQSVRALAAEIGRQPDQQTAEVTSRIDALANRVRLPPDAPQAKASQPTATPRVDPAPPATKTDQVATVIGEQKASTLEPGNIMHTIMKAIRQPRPEPSDAIDKQLTPMDDRISAYNARMQTGQEDADMRRAEQAGTKALGAMKEFTDGPGAVLMTRIRDAAKADPDGMTGVLSEMRDGGRYAGLRQDLTVSLQHENFAAAHTKAVSSVAEFGTARAEVDRFAGQRTDATAIAGRFQKLDAEIGNAASEIPGRTEGKSAADELGKRVQDVVMKAVEAVANLFNRLRGASPSASPSPGPS